MIPAELAAGLRTAARASEDAVLAELAVAAMFRNEYAAALAPQRDPPSATPELHARALELYPYVVLRDREADRLRQEAALLREAADLIETLTQKE